MGKSRWAFISEGENTKNSNGGVNSGPSGCWCPPGVKPSVSLLLSWDLHIVICLVNNILFLGIWLGCQFPVLFDQYRLAGSLLEEQSRWRTLPRGALYHGCERKWVPHYLGWQVLCQSRTKRGGFRVESLCVCMHVLGVCVGFGAWGDSTV